MQGIFVFAMVCVLISEGNATFIRNDIWNSEIDLLTDASEKAPDNIRPLVSLGVKYLSLNEIEKTKEVYRHAERLYKMRPDAYQRNWVALLYYNAGIAAMREKNDKKAIQLLLKSSEIDPTSWETHVNLGFLLFKRGDRRNAQNALANAVQLKPGKAYIYNALGRILYANNRPELAIDALKAGIKLEKSRELQHNLVALYLSKNDLQLARSTFFQIPYTPDDMIYQLYRAVFSSGPERSLALDKVAEKMVEGRIDYCSWVKKVEENNNQSLIYPNDFKYLVSELRELYKKKIAIMADEMAKIQSTADSCEEIESACSTVTE